MSLIRTNLAKVPAYRPGRAVPGMIKLSSNEVPDGPGPEVLRAIADAVRSANLYPDLHATELTTKLATACQVGAERVAVGSGSVALLRSLVNVVCEPDDEVLFCLPSFEGYPLLVRIGGAQAVHVPATAGHELDLDAMRTAITPRTRLIFLTTPNNPTGTAIRREDLEHFLAQVPGHVVVAIDEAYREFVTDPGVPDGLEYARSHDNVVVLRTFSKAYGLAGLRIGYAVAAEGIAAALNTLRIPFSLGAVAQAAAIAALDGQEILQARCRRITAERDRIRRELLEHGYDVPPSQANFVWLALGDESTAFAQHTEKHKVIVRPYPGTGVRVTIGTPAQNDTFLGAARDYAHHRP
ncbi:histidinol-phosphate transaminase [Amycolatopsis jejuensis]|uniref:histidinol-phosphate transaminase n=1 Tax=Amycolatopsis jejuensis TaxID=330084 RepID=UPI000527E159|nr:histidinol-phosphate transaminase [Amycolatopsis jejuensis]